MLFPMSKILDVWPFISLVQQTKMVQSRYFVIFRVLSLGNCLHCGLIYVKSTVIDTHLDLVQQFLPYISS